MTSQSQTERIKNVLGISLEGREDIVVIGLGGIGSIVARYLSVFLAGFDDYCFDIEFVDGDAFEEGNKYRMVVPENCNKAEAMAAEMTRSVTRPGIMFMDDPVYVTEENIDGIIRSDSTVFLCVDNHKTRKLVSDFCQTLDTVTLISAGNDGVDEDAGETGTYANVQAYVRKDGEELTVPLDKFHPEIKNPADKSPDELDCLEAAAAGAPQLVFANLAAASAMLNVFMRLLTEKEPLDEVALDISELVMTPITY